MHQRITTVALYDTLGPDATRFVCNQTELITIAVEGGCVGKLVKMKKEDQDGKMSRLANLISFDPISDDDRNAAQAAGITMYHFDEIVQKGRDAYA